MCIIRQQAANAGAHAAGITKLCYARGCRICGHHYVWGREHSGDANVVAMLCPACMVVEEGRDGKRVCRSEARTAQEAADDAREAQEGGDRPWVRKAAEASASAEGSLVRGVAAGRGVAGWRGVAGAQPGHACRRQGEAPGLGTAQQGQGERAGRAGMGGDEQSGGMERARAHGRVWTLSDLVGVQAGGGWSMGCTRATMRHH